MLALPYIDEVVRCPVCCGWGNYSIGHSYLDRLTPCTCCGTRGTMFLGEVRMYDFQQLAKHG